MLKEDYLITIIGRQSSDDENDEIKVDTVGTYTIKNGVKYIVYKEYETDIPNSIGRTAILKIAEDDVVTLSRAGSATKLVLEQGKRHSCLYDTGYGQFQMGVFTSKMKNELGKNGGKLNINYTLDINSNMSSKNELYVEVKSAQKGNLKCLN